MHKVSFRPVVTEEMKEAAGQVLENVISGRIRIVIPRASGSRRSSPRLCKDRTGATLQNWVP